MILNLHITFLIIFWRTWVLVVGSLIPLFWTSGDVYSRFQRQSLICAWQRHTCNTFHEIDLWCDTWRPLGGQHSSRAISSTQLWAGFGGAGTGTYHVDALTTELCQWKEMVSLGDAAISLHTILSFCSIFWGNGSILG